MSCFWSHVLSSFPPVCECKSFSLPPPLSITLFLLPSNTSVSLSQFTVLLNVSIFLFGFWNSQDLRSFIVISSIMHHTWRESKNRFSLTWCSQWKENIKFIKHKIKIEELSNVQCRIILFSKKEKCIILLSEQQIY